MNFLGKQNLLRAGILAAAAIFPFGVGLAATASYTGTLSSPEDQFEATVTLSTPGIIGLQTYGFGGGTNAAGTVIPAGGFDPLVAIFDGADAHALEQASADDLSNYSSFEGCGPAGLVTIGSVPGNCGDVHMVLSLPAGTYTVLLTDADYIPNAVFDNGALSEGFTDLTGGSFPLQTCVDSADCNNDTPNWALDITTRGGVVSTTPEPATLVPAGLAIAVLALAAKQKRF